MKIQVREYRRKMSPEELQSYLKTKSGNGSHKNRKAYSRKDKHKGGGY